MSQLHYVFSTLLLNHIVVASKEKDRKQKQKRLRSSRQHQASNYLTVEDSSSQASYSSEEDNIHSSPTLSWTSAENDTHITGGPYDNTGGMQIETGGMENRNETGGIEYRNETGGMEIQNETGRTGHLSETVKVDEGDREGSSALYGGEGGTLMEEFNQLTEAQVITDIHDTETNLLPPSPPLMLAPPISPPPSNISPSMTPPSRTSPFHSQSPSLELDSSSTTAPLQSTSTTIVSAASQSSILVPASSPSPILVPRTSLSPVLVSHSLSHRQTRSSVSPVHTIGSLPNPPLPRSTPPPRRSPPPPARSPPPSRHFPPPKHSPPPPAHSPPPTLSPPPTHSPPPAPEASEEVMDNNPFVESSYQTRHVTSPARVTSPNPFIEEEEEALPDVRSDEVSGEGGGDTELESTLKRTSTNPFIPLSDVAALADSTNPFDETTTNPFEIPPPTLVSPSNPFDDDVIATEEEATPSCTIKVEPEEEGAESGWSEVSSTAGDALPSLEESHCIPLSVFQQDRATPSDLSSQYDKLSDLSNQFDKVSNLSSQFDKTSEGEWSRPGSAGRERSDVDTVSSVPSSIDLSMIDEGDPLDDELHPQEDYYENEVSEFDINMNKAATLCTCNKFIMFCMAGNFRERKLPRISRILARLRKFSWQTPHACATNMWPMV